MSVAVAVVIAAAAPASAVGAEVGHFTGTNLMTFTAAAGESNQVTVTPGGALPSNGDPAITIADRVVTSGSTDLNPIGDCEQDTDTEVVLCPAAEITTLQFSGGDMDDRLTNSTALVVQASGDDGHDMLVGGSAGDQLEGGPGPDQLDGGPGNDQLYAATLQAPAAGTDSDVLAGGIGDDRLFGGGGADRVDGGPGVDQLQGAGGADVMQGGDGSDRLLGEDGNDTEDGGADNDDLLGGAGNDSLGPGPGPPFADADAISGGVGFDAVSYAARMAPVNVSKNGVADDGGLTERDNVGADVERIRGGLASDTLSGGPGTDVLEGLPGDDTIAGLEGDDTLLGDAGPGSGADTLSGGGGKDSVQGEGGNDSLNGGAGPDQLLGGPGRDTVTYTDEPDVNVSLVAHTATTGLPGDQDSIDQVENVRGGNDEDTVTGSDDANDLTGTAGQDYLDGLRGVDGLDGGSSADVVVARDGTADKLVSCGSGKDLAIIDRRDSVAKRGRRRCEHVDDGSKTKPRPGRVYVQPKRCGADQVELGLPEQDRLVPLRYSVLLPSGYRNRPAPTLDASDCRVRLTATPGRGRRASADVSGGAASVNQSSGRRVATTLSVQRPACAAGARTTKAAARKSRLRVRSRRGRGRWRVKGRFSIGASVGTAWTTVEDCASTTTIVRKGRVRVTDRVRHRTVIVRAGDSYVARR